MLARARCFIKKAASSRLSCRNSVIASQHWRSYSSARPEDEPLRILFCGSDEFSITCLQALHRYSRLLETNVASIDVATRTDKRTGRGLKTITSPPIKYVAEQLTLPVHQFDTFTGWNLPTLPSIKETHINMVIAVSFGRLVPPRILRACKFGGLNVHPSMLPDLKGSAPIEHAIINGYERTGVTVQTLHPTKFDEGQIVLQTPLPGIEIPNPNRITAGQLRTLLAEDAAAMLVRALKERLYLRPKPQDSSALAQENLRLAHKFSPEDRRINFVTMTTTRILRLQRALASLWAKPPVLEDVEGVAADIRILFNSELRLATTTELQTVPEGILANTTTGVPFCVTRIEDPTELSQSRLFIRTIDQKYLCVPNMGVSGMKAGKAGGLAAKARLFKPPVLLEGSGLAYHEFISPLA